MKRSNIISLILTILLLGGLVAASHGAVSGAKSALNTCGSVIIPCLFPFFVVSFLSNRLGLPQALGRLLHSPMILLFGVSGTGAGVFLMGILGGYPVGASVIADLVRQGELSPKEGNRLLAFCNNSGPAFLIGAVGVGVFRSSTAGLLLYGVHVLAAVITGLFLSDSRHPNAVPADPVLTTINLSSALPEAISAAAIQTVQICGYVVFFGALTGMLEQMGVFSDLYGSLAAVSGLTLRHTKALCMGLLEPGCGIGAMTGTALTPQALTICAVITGFGGLSVSMQTAGVLHDTDLQLRHHILGRICTACIGGFIMYTLSSMIL